MTPETADNVLRYLTYGLFAFTALWAVTGTISFLHRRAYNLTRAESSRSKDIRPDFLTVDKARRQEAIERGAAYDKVLQDRAAASPGTAETASLWARLAAMTTAILAILTLIVGALASVDSLQTSVEKLSSWDHLSRMVGEHKAGTIIALIVIGANVIAFVEGSKKWRSAKTTPTR